MKKFYGSSDSEDRKRETLVRNTKGKLKDLIAEYISIMPRVKFVVVKYFHDIENKRVGGESSSQSKFSNALIYETVLRSIVFGKLQRIEKYLGSSSVSYKSGLAKKGLFKGLGKGKPAAEGLELQRTEKVRYGFQAICAHEKAADPHNCTLVFLVFTKDRVTQKDRMFILESGDEKPCSICPLDSLCPKFPEVIEELKPEEISSIVLLNDKRSVIISAQSDDKKSLTSYTLDLVSEVERISFLEQVKQMFRMPEDYVSRERDDFLFKDQLESAADPEAPYDALYTGIYVTNNDFASNDDSYNKMELFKQNPKIFIVLRDDEISFYRLD